MITTKRYDYVPFGSISEHPDIVNHRPLDPAKVIHYTKDIGNNGLIEPIIVWERNHGEYFLIGGFHRYNAVIKIREQHPDHFGRIDVRVVSGDMDEMRALNLKLNADRVETRVSDFFDTIVYLNNANWTKERIGEFLDRSVGWIEDILRFAPGMDPRLRAMMEKGELSWSKAKQICRLALAAAPGQEMDVIDQALAGATNAQKPKRPFTLNTFARRLSHHAEKSPEQSSTVSLEDLHCLFKVLQGHAFDHQHVERVRTAFPGFAD